jgi:hypothetical protein
MTTTFCFPIHTPQEKHHLLEMSDYHLISDLNGVLVATGEGQIRTHLVVLRLGLKEFLSTCVKKFMAYIWSSTMKKNFSKHLEITIEKTGNRLLFFKIMDQSLCFRNDHFLPNKPDNPIFHKNLLEFLVQFLGTTFENTLLIDNMPHKSLFNPLFSAIFLTHSTSCIVTLITCSRPFFLIWNLCICPKCRFINL